MHDQHSTPPEVAISKLEACAALCHHAAQAIEDEEFDLAEDIMLKAGAKLVYAEQEVAMARRTIAEPVLNRWERALRKIAG